MAKPNWKIDQTGTRYKTYIDFEEEEHPELEGYVTQKGDNWEWALHLGGEAIESGSEASETLAKEAVDKVAEDEMEDLIDDDSDDDFDLH